MPNPRKPFRINVGFIIHEEVGYSHEIPFEIEKIKLEDLELQNLVGKVDIGRTPQGLVVQGQFSADTQLECVRCLREFSYPPDCKGLCPVCGQDLNVRDCGHRPDASDSPFARIKDLLDE